MVTKEVVLKGLGMFHNRLKEDFADNTVVVGTKSSTVEGAMWFSIEDDLYWSLYMCMNGQRIEVAYGQFKGRN